MFKVMIGVMVFIANDIEEVRILSNDRKEVTIQSNDRSNDIHRSIKNTFFSDSFFHACTLQRYRYPSLLRNSKTKKRNLETGNF